VTEQTVKGKTVSTTTRNVIRRFWSGAWVTISTAFPVKRLVCVGSNVFAVGQNADSTAWQVRKSTDKGVTWTLLEEYRLDPNSTTNGSDLAADSQGNLYVAGMGHRKTISGSGKTQTTVTERFWVVRKGAAGGTQWANSDVFALPRGLHSMGGGSYWGRSSWPYELAVDGQDNVYAIGVGVEDIEGQHWITRRLPAGTIEWTSSDDYVVSGSADMQGEHIAPDAFGNVFATGFWATWTERHDWIVRRTLAAGSTAP
jgi:hypothetical protein